jgi:hypothetical protein
MNSPKDNQVFDNESKIATIKDDETESVEEKPFPLLKITKKTRSPEFSIDSLILRKKKDVICGNK